MAHYAAQDGGEGPQSQPFGYDAHWLSQQPSQLHFGSPEHFTFTHQHPHDSRSGGSILNQNDNSLLGDFFSNPDITSQMAFNYDGTGEDVGGDGENHKLFDLDNQGGLGNDALSHPLYNLGGEHITQAGGGQQQSMSSQMAGTSDDHEQSGGAADEEETKAQVAQGLMGMSSNRLNPAQMMFNNMGELGGAGGNGNTWGGLGMNSPLLHMQTQILQGRRSAGPASQNTRVQHQGQAGDDQFGYLMPNMPSQFQSANLMSMPHQAAQARGGPYSMSNIQGGRHGQLPLNELHFAHMRNSNFANFYNSSTTSSRPMPGPVRFGSDENFGTSGYHPPNNYDSPDEKGGNLNHVPLADEASASNRPRSHAPTMLRPNGRNFSAQQHRPQDFPSPVSQPTTPTSAGNNQNYGTGYAPTNSHGVYGMGTTHGHTHYPQQYQPAHFPSAAHQNRQIQEVGSQESSSSSEQAASDSDSRAAPSQPARKRRRSTYEEDDEDEYKPPTGRNDGPNRTLDGASEEDDEYRPDTSTSNKRARSSATRRQSNTQDAPTSSTMRAPRASSGSGKKPSRKRQSGTVIPRQPLSDEQRRQNHIQSEKNRRDLIKINYENLYDIVPGLRRGRNGMSKSDVLKEIIEFVEELEQGNEYLEDMLGIEHCEYPGKSYGDEEYEDEDDQADGGMAGALGGGYGMGGGIESH